jgi:GIY-YIG catalytic domain/NUMOD1 domain
MFKDFFKIQNGFHKGNSVLNCNSNNKTTNIPSIKQQWTEEKMPLNTESINQHNNGPVQNWVIPMGAGLYAIFCISTNKVHIGHSDNIAGRLGVHYTELIKGRHECAEMQLDWNKYGETNFKFIVLSVGSQWDSKKVRIQSETTLISDNKENVYNKSVGGSTPKRQADLYKKQVRHGTVLYPSIAAASRDTGISEMHIRRCLRDPNNTEWSYESNILEESNMVNMNKARKVKVKGVIYRSVKAAAKETQISARTLTRWLKSPLPEYDDYTYVD